MFATIVTRAAQITAAIVSATLLTAFVTVLPTPVQAEQRAARTATQR